jgi:transposase
LALQQAPARYDADPDPGRECEAAIARRFRAIKPVWSDARPPPDRGTTPRTHHKKAPTGEARSRLSQVVGVDLSAIPGLNAGTGHTMRSEIGRDLRQWPHAKACCAWVGLAPPRESSGGQISRRSTLQTRHRAGQAVRLAAPAVSRRPNRFGAYARRRRARLGPKAAVVAAAHQLARLVYSRRTHRTPDRDRSAEDEAQHARQRDSVAPRTKAAKLGWALVESPA